VQTWCQAPLLSRVGMLVNTVQSPGANPVPGTGLRRGEMLANSGPSTQPFVPGTDWRGRFLALIGGGGLLALDRSNQTDRTDCLNEWMVRSAAFWESGSGKTSALRNPR